MRRTAVAIRLMTLIILGFFLTGCVTTKNKTSMDQLQTRIVELEQKLDEKDAEIVDLKYELKDVSTKVDSIHTTESAPSRSSAAAISAEPSAEKDDSVVKVSASAVDIQTALKNAGFYNGAIDGKIGSQTKRAIVSFQKSRKLKADGVIGKRTWEELNAYLQ